MIKAGSQNAEQLQAIKKIERAFAKHVTLVLVSLVTALTAVALWPDVSPAVLLAWLAFLLAMVIRACAMHPSSLDLFATTERNAGIADSPQKNTRQHATEVHCRSDFQQALLSGIRGAGLNLLLVENGGIKYVLDEGILLQCGYTGKDVAAGLPLTALIHPDDRQQMQDKYRRLLDGEAEATNFDIGVLFADGRRREYEISAPLVPGPEPVQTFFIFRDVTERKQSELYFQEAFELRDGIINAIPDLLFELNREGRYLNILAQNPEQLARQKEALLGKTVHDALAPDAAAIVMDSIRDADEHGLSFGKIIRLDLSGTISWFELSTSRKSSNESSAVSFIMLSRDVTARKQMEAALEAREQEALTLIENAPNIIARYDSECRCLFANPAFGAKVRGGIPAMIGRKPSEQPGGSYSELYEDKIREVLDSGANAEFELIWESEDGKEVCSYICLTAERDSSGKIVTALAVGRDISELNIYRKRLHQMAFYDSLTSLPNRALLNDRLQQLLSDSFRHHQLAGVMLLDLDRFKVVNDTLGHSAGDKLLCEAASRLMYSVREYDTVARLSGDEFAILLPEVRLGDDLGRVAGKIQKAFKEPFMLDGKEVFVSCSIGISVYPSDGDSAADLLKQAESAMYFAKRSGRNTFRFFSSDMMDSANERLTLETDLRRGFTRGELELHYQPKVSLRDGALIGSEALLRWEHPQLGMVSPDIFIPIAEDCGFIVELGEWVLRNACRTAREWNGPGKPLHKVAINLSVRQFQFNDLLKTVHQVLSETACLPEWIELEITEGLLMDENDVVQDILEGFRAMGISIAIDDFGTGYSALSYLARFPIDTLKIDRSFTNRISEQGHHAELLKTIIAIAYSLNQTVVAEGVETEEEAAFLRKHGCHVAQGYLYGKPMPKTVFEQFSIAFGRGEYFKKPL